MALALAAAGLAVVGAPAAALGTDIVPGQVIVRFEPGVAAPARAAVLEDVGGRVVRSLPIARTALVSTPGQAPEDAARALEGDPRVRWAEPNYIYRRRLVPNDPGLSQQWGLLNTGQTVLGTAGTPGADIDVVPAWDVANSSPGVRLAVVDGGVNGTHPDLAPSFGAPANPDETGAGRETNGIDDDGNGFVDDHRGWDFVAADNDPRDDDPFGHGTLAAGTATARGNDGVGVAGVTWQTRLIALRALDSSGAGTNANIARAIVYAGERGVRVLNASFGGGSSSQAIRDAIAEAPNMLFVTAAGNGGSDGVGDDADAPGEIDFPCELTLPNVVCVAATDQSDGLTAFSNFGAVSVNLAAPGRNIFGPQPGGSFAHLSGTSFATPLVAGAASLVLGATPAASTAQLRGAVLAGAEPLPGLAGRVVTGGRLDVARALASVPPGAPGPSVQTGPAADVAGSTARLTGTATPRGQPTSTYFEYGTTTAYGSATATRRAGSGVSAVALSDGIRDLVPGSRYEFRAVAADAGGISYGPNESFTAPGPATVAATPIAARDLSIVRRGRSWFIRLRLSSFTTVAGLVDRRATRARNFRRAFGIRRRGYPPGIRLIPLGRLRPALYRLTLNVNSAAGPQRLRRGFRVTGSPILSIRIQTLGGVTSARVRLAARAKVRGGLERRRGSRFVFLHPLETRLGAGTTTIRLGRNLQPGLYRLRLSAPAFPGAPESATFRIP